MKKLISAVIAAALSLALSVSAFATASDVDALKSLVNSVQGITDSQRAQAIAFIDEYGAAHPDAITADVVSDLQNLYNTALATPADQRTESVIAGFVDQGVAILARAGVTVTVDSISVANGVATVTGSVSAPDATTQSFAGSIDAASTTSGGTTGGSTAAGGSTVIKNTGVSAQSVAVLGIALAGTLGAAVIGVRKMGLLAR